MKYEESRRKNRRAKGQMPRVTLRKIWRLREEEEYEIARGGTYTDTT
jgi:hypothetical protein